ncbi:hypothetical protein JCM6882_007401 [Rhodosporidiobolus microsporus]
MASSAPAKKRGRKIDESLPPSRSREIQRAFRARRAALLSNLEARVVHLEAENAELRRRAGLPPDGPPVTGKVLVLTSVDGETPGADIGKPGVASSAKGKGKRVREEEDDGEEEREESAGVDGGEEQYAQEGAWSGADAAMGAAAEVLGELGRAAASPQGQFPSNGASTGPLPTPPNGFAGPSGLAHHPPPHAYGAAPPFSGPSPLAPFPPQIAHSPAQGAQQPYPPPPPPAGYPPPPLHRSQPSASPALPPFSTLPSPALGVPPYPFPQAHQPHAPFPPPHAHAPPPPPHSSAPPPSFLTSALTDAASHLPPEIQAQALALALAAVQSHPPEQAQALSMALMMSSAAASTASNASASPHSVSHPSPHPSLPSPAPSLGLYPSSHSRAQSHTSPAASNPSPAAPSRLSAAGSSATSPAAVPTPGSVAPSPAPPPAPSAASTSAPADSQQQQQLQLQSYLLRTIPPLPPAPLKLPSLGCCPPPPPYATEHAKEEAKYAMFCARVVVGAAVAAQAGRLKEEEHGAGGAEGDGKAKEKEKEAKKDPKDLCCGGLIDCSDPTVFDSTPSFPGGGTGSSASPLLPATVPLAPAPATAPTPTSPSSFLPPPAPNDPYISLPAAFAVLTKYMSAPGADATSPPHPPPARPPPPPQPPPPGGGAHLINLPGGGGHATSPANPAPSVRRPTPIGLAEMLFDAYALPSGGEAPAFSLVSAPSSAGPGGEAPGPEGKELRVRQWKVDMTRSALEIRRLVTEEGVEVEEARRRVFGAGMGARKGE